VHLVGFIMRKL